jgi:hypothetical protein
VGALADARAAARVASPAWFRAAPAAAPVIPEAGRMSARRALAVAVWQRARAAHFPVVARAPGFAVGHGPRPWHRFVDQAGVAELRAAVAALDELQQSQLTASDGGAMPRR